MSTINIKDNLIEGVTFHSSPNFDSRPKDTDISLIVIHSISLPPGKYGGNEIKDFFLNELDTSNHEYFESIKIASHPQRSESSLSLLELELFFDPTTIINSFSRANCLTASCLF